MVSARCLHYKLISLTLQRNDLHAGIAAEIGPQFSDVHVEVPRVKKGIITPHFHKQGLALDGAVYIFAQQVQHLRLAVGELYNFNW